MILYDAQESGMAQDNQMISQSAEKSAHCEELAKKVEETTQKYMEEYKHTIGESMNCLLWGSLQL